MAGRGRPPGRTKTVYITMRIDPATDQLWEDTAKLLGISKVGLAVQAIRKMARSEGVEERPAETKGEDQQ